MLTEIDKSTFTRSREVLVCTGCERWFEKPSPTEFAARLCPWSNCRARLALQLVLAKEDGEEHLDKMMREDLASFQKWLDDLVERANQ